MCIFIADEDEFNQKTNIIDYCNNHIILPLSWKSVSDRWTLSLMVLIP